MPVTTILQHAMEREMLAKSDLDTRMSNNEDILSLDQKPMKTNLDTIMENSRDSFGFEQRPVDTNLDAAMMNTEESFTFAPKPTEADLDTTMTSGDNNLTLAQIASKWVQGVESRYPKKSRLSKKKKAASAAGPGISSGSSCRVELLNGISNSKRSKITRPSSRRSAPKAYHIEQINSHVFGKEERALAIPQATPFDNHHAGQNPPTVGNTTTQAYHQTQQGGEVPSTSYHTRTASSTSSNDRETSPDIYTTAEAAYNALMIQNATRTSLTSQSSGQTSPTDYHTAHSSPTSCKTAQTSLEANNDIRTDSGPRDHTAVAGPHPPRSRYRLIASAQPDIRQLFYQQTETTTVPQGGGILLHMTTSQQPTSLPVIASQRKAATRPRRTSRSSATSYSVPTPRPAAALQKAAAPVATQPVYPQPVAVAQPAMKSQPAVAPQSTPSLRQRTIPQPVAISQPPMTISIPMLAPRPAQTVYPMIVSHPAASEPSYPQHPYTRPPTAARPAIDRRESSRLSRNREGSSQIETSRVPYIPEGSTIVEMQPSVGNKVLEYLAQHNPQLVAASKVSNELPASTARHYNSVLSQQAQKIEPSFPLGYPPRNMVESRHLRSDSIPATLEQHYNQYGVPAQHGGIEPATAHANSTPATQQIQSSEGSWHLGHSSTLTSYNGVQSQSYPIVPPERVNNEPCMDDTCSRCIPKSQQQRRFDNGIPEIPRHDGQAISRGSSGTPADIQEISREDWQAANRGNATRKALSKYQSVAGPPQRSGPLRPWTPMPQTNPPPISRVGVEKSENKAPSLRTQPSVPERTASSNTQATTTSEPALLNAPIVQTSTGEFQEGSVYSGIQKADPARGGRNMPLFVPFGEEHFQDGDPSDHAWEPREPPFQVREPYVQVHEPYVQVHEPYVQVHEPYVQVHEPYVQVHEPYVQTQESYIRAQEPHVVLEPRIQTGVPMFVSGSRLMPPPSQVLERPIQAQEPGISLGPRIKAINEVEENLQVRRQASCFLPGFNEAFSHALSIWPLHE